MSRDEFEHYDLSEFTEEELVQFEKHATHNRLETPDDGPKFLPTSQQDIRKAGPSNFGGGPVLDIAFESPADAFLVEAIPKPAVSARKCHSLLPTSTLASPPVHLNRASTHVSRRRLPKRVKKNPYEQFCSWKKGFSVTELVSPVWFVHEIVPSSISYIES